MTDPINLKKAARPVLIAVSIAILGLGYLATRGDGTTVFFPIPVDAAIAIDAPPDSSIDAPVVDAPPAPSTWTMVTVYGPEGAVGLDGADGVDVATIGGKLTIVSPWEESSKVTVSTRTGTDAAATWSSRTIATVSSVEDAKFGDIDGDGALDVVAGGQGAHIRVWFGPDPFGTAIDIGAATNMQYWMQIAITPWASNVFTAANGTDTLTATAHGWSTGDLVRVSNSGGGLPAPLVAATNYYTIRTGANTFKLATTQALAVAGTPIDLTTDGTGTQTAVGGERVWGCGRSATPKTFTADNTNEQLAITAHGMFTGDGIAKVSNSGGALPSGLLSTTNYWVIVVDANTIKLASTKANAIAGTPVNFTTNGTGTQTFTPPARMGYFTSPTPRTANSWTFMSIGSSAWCMSLFVKDVDADGDLDVVQSDRLNTQLLKGTRWWEAPNWTQHTILDVATIYGNPAGEVKFGELVGSDTVMVGGSSSTTENRLWKSTTANGWASFTTTEIATYPDNAGQYQGVATCDITGDGTPDYVLSHSQSSATTCTTAPCAGIIVWNGANPALKTYVDVEAGGRGDKYDNVICMDMDADGDLDILTSEQITGYGVTWFRNPRIP
jgi:hypothetical protein